MSALSQKQGGAGRPPMLSNSSCIRTGIREMTMKVAAAESLATFSTITAPKTTSLPFGSSETSKYVPFWKSASPSMPLFAKYRMMELPRKSDRAEKAKPQSGLSHPQTLPPRQTQSIACVKPTRTDVLFVRGKDCENHPGNLKFLSICRDFQQKYREARR